MKLIGKKGLTGILEGVLWVLFGIVPVALAFLPWIVDNLMMPFNSNPEFWRPRYIVVLAVSGVVAMLMLWQARHVLHNINNSTVFSLDTVRRMKIVSIEAFALSAFYFTMLFLGMMKFSIGLVGLVFALGGLIVLVFAELFREATAYKQENDMTI